MAGNTKLLGFNPGGEVTLSRWGKRFSFKVDPETLKLFKDACHNQLPKQPPERFSTLDEDEASIHYDENVGRIQVTLSPQLAKWLSQVLEEAKSAQDQTGGERAEEWSQLLQSCCQAHEDYLNTDEPGITK